jgi:hypothetical protein
MRRLIWLAALALAGCSIGKDLSAADQAIAAFHKSVDAGEFEQIYDASTQDIKDTTSKPAFTQLLAAIHARLGQFKSGKRESWNDNHGTSGHVVSITYAAIYEKGAASEEFVYRIEQDRAVLAGYHVKSNVLITQ